MTVALTKSVRVTTLAGSSPTNPPWTEPNRCLLRQQYQSWVLFVRVGFGAVHYKSLYHQGEADRYGDRREYTGLTAAIFLLVKWKGLI